VGCSRARHGRARAGGAAIWANSQRDDNGYFSANAHRYQTHTRGIATESITVGSYVPTWLAGKVRLDVSGNKPLFVGIAPKATVDAYLARIQHTEATHLSLDPFKVTYVDNKGTVDPGRPAREPFWAAAVSATSSPLTWKLRSGSWSIVVMDADGSRDVAATIGVGVKVPALLSFGIGKPIRIATINFQITAPPVEEQDLTRSDERRRRHE
jgi:hypothetical protein